MKYHLKFLSDSRFLYCKNFLSLNYISSRTRSSFPVNSNILLSVKNFVYLFLAWYLKMNISSQNFSHVQLRRSVFQETCCVCCVFVLALFKVVVLSNLSEIKWLFVRVCICVCRYVCVYTYVYVCVNTYVYIYTHTYKHFQKFLH